MVEGLLMPSQDRVKTILRGVMVAAVMVVFVCCCCCYCC